MNVIQPAIKSEHFREYRSPLRTLGGGGEQQHHGLPVHRFYHADRMEPKRRLAYADFYRMQIVAKNNFGRGQQSGFRKQDIFFALSSNDKDLYSCCFTSA